MRTISIKRSLITLAMGMILIIYSCSKKDVVPKTSANFTFIVLDPIPPARVEFSNQAANATSYNWDFGDNTSSTEPNPQHFYAKAGTYMVTLRATGSNGVEQKQYQLTVGAKAMLIRSISIDQIPGAPDIATFSATVKYDGGANSLPAYFYLGSEMPSAPFA